MRTFDEQDAAIRARWPSWSLLSFDGATATWRGPIRPNSRRYTVDLRFRFPANAESYDPMQGQPRVRILSPTPELHWDYDQAPLPHVYWVGDGVDDPILCLFDVDSGEWTLDDLMSDTTLKWASLWLNFYEGWLATKKWYGGGTHVAAVAGGDGMKHVAA